MAAVAEEGFRSLNVRFEELVRSEDDPLERIIRQACAYIWFAKENRAQFEAMFGFSLDRYFDYPALRDAAAVSFMNMLKSVGTCQAVGVVREGDLMSISFSGWTLIHGLATLVTNGLTPFRTETREDMETISRDYIMRYLEGVADTPDETPLVVFHLL